MKKESTAGTITTGSEGMPVRAGYGQLLRADQPGPYIQGFADEEVNKLRAEQGTGTGLKLLESQLKKRVFVGLDFRRSA